MTTTAQQLTGFSSAIPGMPNTERATAFGLIDGWYTRSYPHLIPDTALYVADNVVYTQDGILSKRPGNVNYGGGAGTTGSGNPILALTRFYPPGSSPVLVAHSHGKFYKGNDSTGAFTAINSSASTTQPATFAQMYDPDMSSGAATALFICDGSRVPQAWDGTNFVAVQTSSGFLPTNAITSEPITPKYCVQWGFHLVYGGDPNDPCGIWISDALRPERFTGDGFIDSQGQAYQAYYPNGRNGTLGVITGLAVVGVFLVVFFTNGIVVWQNTGSSGAFEYIDATLSTQIGCPAPQSIVNLGDRIAFFGGDRFYWTDSQQIVPLPDVVPTLYSRENISYAPPLIADITSVIGSRRGLQYWASYNTTSGASNTQVAIYDFGCNQGRGAWSRLLNMPMNCALECRGPGDTYQFFWGSAAADLVAQYDTGVFSDFGSAVAMECQTKAYTFERPAHLKTVQGVYVGVVVKNSGTYTITPVVSLYLDGQQTAAVPITINVSPLGVTYGSEDAIYGEFLYEDSSQYVLLILKCWPPTLSAGLAPCKTVQADFYESSSYPVGLIGLIMEVTVDEPLP